MIRTSCESAGPKRRAPAGRARAPLYDQDTGSNKRPGLRWLAIPSIRQRKRMLPGNPPHIGIVVDTKSGDGLRPLVVHNIGAGPALEDRLFAFPITGHYRYDRSD